MNASYGGIDRNFLNAWQMRNAETTSTRTAPHARASPNAPPATPNSVLSSNKSRAMRPHPAPERGPDRQFLPASIRPNQ